MFEWLRDEGYDGSYTTVKRRTRGASAAEARAELADAGVRPGEIAESDWSPYTVLFTTGLTNR